MTGRIAAARREMAAAPSRSRSAVSAATGAEFPAPSPALAMQRTLETMFAEPAPQRMDVSTLSRAVTLAAMLTGSAIACAAFWGAIVRWAIASLA